MRRSSSTAQLRIVARHAALISLPSSLEEAPFSQKCSLVMGRGVRRRWYLDLHGIRREGTKETGFRFRTPEGRPIDDEKTLARIARLRIPPAWREVRIARSDSAPLQAVGVDK